MSAIKPDLELLPEHLLFDIARNESAPHVFRRECFDLLAGRGSSKTEHPDLKALKEEYDSEQAELVEVEIVPETVAGSDLVREGPFKASVTTASMFGVQKIDDIQPADEAQSSSTTNNDKENQ
jgi:hypothetical protein